MARHFSKYNKEKNAGGYLAIAQGVKGVAPKSVDKLDEKIAGQIDGTNRPMVFGMPVYEKGGRLTARTRFTDYDFDRLSYDFVVFDDRVETEDGKVVGTINSKGHLIPKGDKTLKNPLVKWLQQNSYVSNEEYQKLAKGGKVNLDSWFVKLPLDTQLEITGMRYNPNADEYRQEALYTELETEFYGYPQNKRLAIYEKYKNVKSPYDYGFAKGGALSKAYKMDKNFIIYVPSTTDVGKKISRAELNKRVDEVRTYVANMFGGFSSTEVDGGYKASDGDIVEEDIVKVSVFAQDKDWKKNETKVVNKIKEWATRWGQEAIGVEYENDLYYVDEKGMYERGGKVDTHIAETILVQLGGMNRLKMFTGAYNFGALPNGVSFRIKSRGYSLVNYVKITLTPADLYNVEYGRIHNNKYRVIEEDFGLYNDMLVQSFESATNMYLSFARGGSVENFDLMEEYEALSDQNKAIVNLLNLYNPKGRLPRPKQTLKQLNVDEQYMVRQWNVGIENQVSEELVKKMWGLMYEHSTIMQTDVYNVNKGAGRFLMNAGSDTLCYYDMSKNRLKHFGSYFDQDNELAQLVDDEIVRSFAQRNSKRINQGTFNKKGSLSGMIGVVDVMNMEFIINFTNILALRPASLVVLIAPLFDGKIIEGLREVKKNIVIKNAFENGIDGQLVIKEM